MVRCVVTGCHNYTGKKNKKFIRYFVFPKCKEQQDDWLKFCGRRLTEINENTRVCSEHFTDDDWTLKDVLLNVPKHLRRLKPDAVPSMKLPVKGLTRCLTKKQLAQETCLRKQLVEESIAAYERAQQENAKTNADVRREQHTHLQFHNYSFINIDHVKPTKDSELNSGKDSNNKICARSIASQTEVDFNCSKEFHIITLERALRRLIFQHKKCIKKLQRVERTSAKMQQIFTKSQIRRLQSEKTKCYWTSEDIYFAMSLHAAGPQAYQMLLDKKYPFPALTTLTKWKAKNKLNVSKISEP